MQFWTARAAPTAPGNTCGPTPAEVLPTSLVRLERRKGEVARLMISVPVPPGDHRDHPALKLMVTLLAGGRAIDAGWAVVYGIVATAVGGTPELVREGENGFLLPPGDAGLTRRVKAAGHFDKNGFFYVLDRTNGAFLQATPFVYQNWNKGFDAKGRPIVVPGSNSSPEGTFLVYPTLVGGTNYQPPSYSPVTGLFYLEYAEGGQQYVSGPAEYGRAQQYIGRPQGGRGAPAARGPNDPPPSAGIKALDVDGRLVEEGRALARGARPPGFAARGFASAARTSLNERSPRPQAFKTSAGSGHALERLTEREHARDGHQIGGLLHPQPVPRWAYNSHR